MECLKENIHVVNNRDIKQFEERYNLNKIYNTTQKGGEGGGRGDRDGEDM